MSVRISKDTLPLLLVEDGPLTLLSTKTALEEDGYRVMAMRHGSSALRALDQPLCGLITDIRLPGPFDGWQIAQEARSIWPELPVMYITGEGDDDWPHKSVPGSVILRKPYTARTLRATVARLMRAPAAAQHDSRTAASTLIGPG
jgi:DNA-binding response OmpR family regulator